MSVIDLPVCIIGAGVAGLKCAQTLLTTSKFTAEDLVIVEAQDRIGGRVLTDTTSSKIGIPYDLGASWFHDCLSNVIFQHFYSGKDNDIFDVKKDGFFDDSAVKEFSSSGPIDQIKTRFETILHDMETFSEMYFIDKVKAADDLSLKDFIDIYIEKYGQLLTEQELRFAKVSIRFYELWHGVSWEQLSARYAVLGHNGRNLYNKKGNKVIIDLLLRDIPSDRILLKHPVKEILRNAKKDVAGCTRNISIVTHNGVRINCDYLLVTVPQSVLALDYKEEPRYALKWTPELPEIITSAVRKIHFASLGKVIFEFDSIWWDKVFDRFSIQPDVEVESFGTSKLTKLPKPFSFPALVVNASKVHADKTNKGSLVLLTQNPLTEYLEEHPEEAWTYFKPMLQTIALDASVPIPDPINCITTEWTKNPYARGSYAACFKGDEPAEIINILSGEIEGIGLSGTTVRFAGEHAISEGEGCIHGAWISGEREAKWISKHANKKIVNSSKL